MDAEARKRVRRWAEYLTATPTGTSSSQANGDRAEDGCDLFALLDALDAAEARADAAAGGRWIACSERMPEEDGDYVVALSSGDTMPGWFEDGGWLVLEGPMFFPRYRVPPSDFNCAVTHWMPLPPMPAGGAEAGE